MTALTPGERMPEGSRCSAYFSSPMTTVWPALLPPLNLTTQSVRSPSRSVALPLPSSPHWTPTITMPGMGHSPGSDPTVHPILSRPAGGPRGLTTARGAADRARTPPLVWAHASHPRLGPDLVDPAAGHVRRHRRGDRRPALAFGLARGRRRGNDVGTIVANFFSFFTILSNAASVVVLAWAAIWYFTRGAPREVGAARTRDRPGVGHDVHDRDRARLQHPAAQHRAAAGSRPIPWSNEMLHVIAPIFLLLDLFLGPLRRRLQLERGLRDRGLPDRLGRLHPGAGPVRDQSDQRQSRTGTRTPSWTRTTSDGYLGVAVYIVGIAVAIMAVGVLVVWVGRRRGTRFVDFAQPFCPPFGLLRLFAVPRFLAVGAGRPLPLVSWG